MNTPDRKKFAYIACATLIATLGAHFPHLHAQVPREGARRETTREVEAKRMANERARSNFLKAEVAQSLRVTPVELAEFIKAELKNDAKAKEAYTQLFASLSASVKPGARAEDFRAAEVQSETLSSFIALKRSNLVSDFHIGAKDLVAISKAWTPTQKENFARTLRRASVIASERGRSKVLTMEDAFERALKEEGRLDKYREGCRF